jgi:hypothetical protein
MKTIVINQAAGLGDIIFIQPIMDRYIAAGFQVILPVIDRYYLMVSKYLKRDGVSYVHIDSDYPFKSSFDNPNALNDGNYHYVPLTYSHYYFPKAPLMVSKYLLTGTPLSDYRLSCPKIRDFKRELQLIDLMNPSNEPFILLSKLYGTPPNSSEREMKIDASGVKIIEIDYRDERQAMYHPFDWIGLIQAAQSIHIVQGSISLITDMYAQPNTKLHLYDRVATGGSPQFFRNIEFVQRDPNWIYYL